ncbi:AraC family transcriptional regulator ligand-binding domain-containing protein [Nocardia sp. CWNU-33]|uniref:AraC family transcriptional regulator n=1 Tax=Nocardia sp. CWNU-33 TaxID=3392117 RepID=UPI00398F57EE
MLNYSLDRRMICAVDAVDHIFLPKYVLDTTGLAESVRQRLADEVDVPGWMLSSTSAILPSDRYLRLWELAEHELDDPDVALRAALAYVPGQLGLIDYLFTTAPTLGEGLALTGMYIGTSTTNHHFTIVGESEDQMSVDLSLLQGEGRGRDLAIQVALAGTVTKIRRVTGQQVNPVRVRFRQSAPPRHDQFIELFGTARIDFGAPTNQLTFRTADLALPMLTADPVLAAILHRSAGAMAQPRITTWSERLQQVLAVMMDDGTVTIDPVARRMAMSRRSLQRRLAEEGTTWRQEIDRARRSRLEDRSRWSPTTNRTEMAHLLGYSDARSLGRAYRRWSQP